MTEDAFICDYVRTPIGRYGGALASLRADDLAALPIRELMRRHPGLGEKIDEVFLGCANQAGEDNRNLARMALLLAGLPESIPGATVNRLCASGMEAVAAAARGDQGGRDRARNRRRRRIDDPRALRDGQGSGGVSAIGGGFRHHHRLALRQSGDEKALWRRFDAGDGRERRRRASGLARRPGRVRAALAKARRGGPGEGDVRRGNCRGRDQGPQGRA